MSPLAGNERRGPGRLPSAADSAPESPRRVAPRPAEAPADPASCRTLDEAIATHQALVLRTALRITRQRQAAEDAAQSVFIHLWEHPEAFDPQRGSLQAWLTTIAHHRAVDAVRRTSAVSRREEVARRAPSTHDVDVEAVVADRLGSEAVRRALDDLPEAQRTAIVLAYFGNRSYRQVALDLGLPEGTVKSRIRSGLQTLAVTLGPMANPSG